MSVCRDEKAYFRVTTLIQCLRPQFKITDVSASSWDIAYPDYNVSQRHCLPEPSAMLLRNELLLRQTCLLAPPAGSLIKSVRTLFPSSHLLYKVLNCILSQCLLFVNINFTASGFRSPLDAFGRVRYLLLRLMWP